MSKKKPKVDLVTVPPPICYLCNGCGLLIEKEQLEIETACRSTLCDHSDTEKCIKGTVYAHPNENCFEVASDRAKEPSRGIIFGAR